RAYRATCCYPSALVCSFLFYSVFILFYLYFGLRLGHWTYVYVGIWKAKREGFSPYGCGTVQLRTGGNDERTNERHRVDTRRKFPGERRTATYRIAAATGFDTR
ncbi:unnamed protein product, partial [Laminaria digitata]